MKIALLGYGRMGRAIEKLALDNGHEIALKINRNNVDDISIKNLQQCDVAIDFSWPSSAWNNIKSCVDAGIPIVSGTTGWTDRLPEMKSYVLGQGGAFLYASNFSIGVNIFFEINQALAKLMDAQDQYKISMEEIHHIHKLDAPSGTGITLAEQIIQEIKRKEKWKEGSSEDENTIPILSKRIDMTPGTHSIKYASDIDTIDITHTAHSRDGFAQGALMAGEWLLGKKGFFSMKDVLF